MDVRLSRLRRGELLAGGSAVLLLVLLFAMDWYRYRGASGATAGVNGWHGLAHLRWLVLITSACALLLVCFQAGRRAPALPSAFSTIVLVLAIPTDLWLVIRVLISPPAHVQAGAYVGLVAGLGLLAGAYLSLRQEGILPADGPQTIPTVPLGERTRS